MDNTINLTDILEKHSKWLRAAEGGSRANLSRADLSRADLSGANLSGADLSRADLSGADLSGANLSRADLSRADLSGANLSGADLSRADLSGANLSGADLSRANLSGADLSRADLSWADLSWADLSGANLRETKLDSTNLSATCLDSNLITLQRAFCQACLADADGYRIVYRTDRSYHVGNMVYEPGKTYEAPVLSADIATACHPGIYAASLEWMRNEYGGCRLAKCRVKDGDWFITAKGCIRTVKLEVLEYVE